MSKLSDKLKECKEAKGDIFKPKEIFRLTNLGDIPAEDLAVMDEKEYKKLLSHDGQLATVVSSAGDHHYDIQCQDGYKLAQLSTTYMKKVE